MVSVLSSSSMHVDDLVRGAVELGVLLGGSDQGGDPAWRSPRSRSSAVRSRGCGSASAVRSEQRGASTEAATCSSQATSSPACTKAGASCQPSASPWASSQSVIASSRSEASSGLRERAPSAPRSAALLLQLDQRLQAGAVVRARRRSSPSLRRMPATRSRSAAVARTAAAAGLFSSWVRPADSDAEREQPLALADHLLQCSWCRRTAPRAGAPPSGTTRASAAANTSAASTKKREGSVTRSELL